MDSKRRRDGVHPRGSNTWRVVVAAGRDPLTGRYMTRRETVHGSKSEAVARRDALRSEVATGTVSYAKRETVTAFLDRFIDHRQSIGKVRPKTAGVYRGYARREITPRIGGMLISGVRPVHVQAVLDEAISGGLAPRSVLQVHRIMHAAFAQAVRWRLISVNPSDGVTPPQAISPDPGHSYPRTDREPPRCGGHTHATTACHSGRSRTSSRGGRRAEMGRGRVGGDCSDADGLRLPPAS